MNADAIRKTLNRQPFVPFEVIMSSGERHTVKHPEFVIITPSHLVIADPITDRLALLSPIQVTELKLLEPADHSA